VEPLIRDETTLEIPDKLCRRAKATAARRGIPLRQLVTEAIADKLESKPGHERPWLRSFGHLSALRSETARIDKIINREFGQIQPEDLR
jgi:hypothetical protein